MQTVVEDRRRFQALASSPDGLIGLALGVAAVALISILGIAHAINQPVYGPIDEVSHTAYVFHVARYGVPPLLGRDRSYLGRKGVKLGGRDVDIPRPEAGSAAIPLGSTGAFGQPEAIQPPLYYFAVAPLARIWSGTDAVRAIRIAGVAMVAIAAVLLFLSVFELASDALGAGFASMVLATQSGITDFLSQVQNDALLLPLSGAVIWLSIRGFNHRRLTWPLAFAASALAVTHVVAIPLAAIAVIVIGWRDIGSCRDRWRGTLLRTMVAGSALSLWVVTNVLRYHALLPRDVSAGASALFGHSNRQFLLLHEIAYPTVVSVVGGAYLNLIASPYSADYRHLSLLLPLVLVGTAVVCAKGEPRRRQALGVMLALFAITFVATFFTVAASLIATGGDIAAMQIHRYYMATYFCGACAAGIAVGGLVAHPWARRVLLVAVPAVEIYWSVNASSFT